MYQSEPTKIRSLANGLYKNLKKNNNGRECLFLIVDRSIDGYSPLYLSQSVISLINEMNGFVDSHVSIGGELFEFSFADKFIQQNYFLNLTDFFKGYNESHPTMTKEKTKENAEDIVYCAKEKTFTQELIETDRILESHTTKLRIVKLLGILQQCKENFITKYSEEEKEFRRNCHLRPKSKKLKSKEEIMMATLVRNEILNDDEWSKLIFNKCNRYQRLPLFEKNPIFKDNEFHPLVTRIALNWGIVKTEGFECMGDDSDANKEFNKIIIWIEGGFTTFEEIEIYKTIQLMKKDVEVIICGNQLLTINSYCEWLKEKS